MPAQGVLVPEERAMRQAVGLEPVVIRRVTFRLDSRLVPGAKSVALVGSWNRWDTAVHHLEIKPDGWWAITIPLACGVHPYLFIVDGYPHNDPDDDYRTPCEWGGWYSVRVIR